MGLVMGDQLLYLLPAMTSFYICGQPLLCVTSRVKFDQMFQLSLEGISFERRALFGDGRTMGDQMLYL